MTSLKFCVLGGGIVGTTTALGLQDRFPEASVTLIAEKFNTETTSDGAAGLFYPFSSFKARDFEQAREIMKESYEYYERVMREEGGAATGISETEGYVLSNISQEEVECPIIVGAVPEYRILTPEEAAACPGTWKYGCYLRSLLVSCRLFLPWALRRFHERGGRVIQRKVSAFGDLVPFEFDVVMNCTGLGARSLCNDADVVPVRGQVMKVWAPWVKTFFLVDDSVYVIPGFETTLGGCKHYNNYSVDVEEDTSARIWRNCTELLPSLKECAVIREWVGLRPQRIPIRLEPEVADVDGRKMKIVHNYGHGSQGITAAPGCSKIAVQHAVELLDARAVASGDPKLVG